MNSTTTLMLSRARGDDLRRAAAERRHHILEPGIVEPQIVDRPAARRTRWADIWTLLLRHPRFNPAR